VTTTTRIGLAGYGFGGRYFHAPLISSAPGAEFAGVVTRSPQRRAEVEKAYPGLPVFNDLAGLAASGAQAVAISTPVSTHMDLVHQAIGLGLAVVCDKPFALDPGAASGAVLAAEHAGVPITVYQNRRWDSDFLTLRRLLDNGSLGQATRFESRFERFQPGEGNGPPVSGGGLLRDFGAHLVDQAIQLFGPVVDVYAEADLPADPSDLSVLEDRFFLALRHESGVMSHLGGDWVQPAPGPRFRVTGTKAAYVVPALMDGQEAALIAGRTPATEQDEWGVQDQLDWGWLQQGPIQTQVPTERGRWDAFYPAFAAAVRGEGELPVDPWESVMAAQVLEAARTSATRRRIVEL
jgi:predicted dehydrogenase